MNVVNLIGELKRCPAEYPIHFSFGHYFPVDLCSYRGDYAQLSITYTDYDEARDLFNAREKNNVKNNELIEPRAVKWWIERLERAANREVFRGYKGGSFEMTNLTDVYVGNYGEYTSATITKLMLSSTFDRVNFIVEPTE